VRTRAAAATMRSVRVLMCLRSSDLDHRYSVSDIHDP
jgi:hypothetical protein